MYGQRRMDTQMQIFERRVYHNTPHFLKLRGIKRIQTEDEEGKDKGKVEDAFNLR